MFALFPILAFAIPLCSQPRGLAHIPLPADMTGTLNGTVYRIRVPANWNGTLMVYAHGYQAPAVQIAPETIASNSPALEEQLISRGYALAGAFFPNSEKEAIQTTHSLTGYFRGAVGNPRRTVVWGSSFGGLIAVKLVETYPGIYDAAIACCGVIAGNPKFMDASLRLSVAYAAAFGWPSDAWGTVGDLHDGLDFYSDVFPRLQLPGPSTIGRWEFIRLVMGLQPPAWWGQDPMTGITGFGYQMFFATQFRARLEQESSGPVAQNTGAVYTLTDMEKAYLAQLGVNATELLAAMNAQPKIAARRSAREHLEHYGSPTGDLRRPLITMHGKYDGAAWVFHESVYRELVKARGNEQNLVQVYVNGPIHGSFTAGQYLAAIDAMEHWLNTGTQPDASFFPASQGFDTSFVAPAWPY